MPGTTSAHAIATTKQDLPPHPITPEGERYLASLDDAGRELHELAVQMLGSSYFVDRTHGFAKWRAATAAAAKQK